MANERLLDLIPDSIKPQLISEVQEYLNQQKQQQQTPQVDPAVIAYAKKLNEQAKNKK